VIWHKIQSPRPASASTIAGLSFDRDKSLNGNHTIEFCISKEMC
jgi:hypothetical protein